MFRQQCRDNLVPSFYEGHESSQLASHQLWTRHVARFRTGCEKNPVAGQRNGEHNEAGFYRCKFRHREESMPTNVSFEQIGICVALQLTRIAP